MHTSFLLVAGQGRGCVWSDEETRVLMEVQAEEAVKKKQQWLDGSVRNIIFAQTGKVLKEEYGTDRNAHQCCEKNEEIEGCFSMPHS